MALSAFANLMLNKQNLETRMRKQVFLLSVLFGLLAVNCTADSDKDSPIKPVIPENPGDKTEAQALNVLCIGNSITRYDYAPDEGWLSTWGMASSKAENDYCHRLEEMLCEKYPDSKVMPLNIDVWERNPSMNLEKLLDRHCDGKDMIVIRLGENVEDVTAFKTGIKKLLQYSKGKARHVFVTGCLWGDEAKETVIAEAAESTKVPYVSLKGIDCPENRPAVGDNLYDKEGNAYSITSEFIAAHPNDRGMERIAEEIMKSFELHVDDEPEPTPDYDAREFSLDNPTTYVFLPASDVATGRAVVLCPGGGYAKGAGNPLGNHYEGNRWAEFFNERGIALIAVNYTAPEGNCRLPIADLETTMKRVRDHAEEWHIDKNDVGIMGFSAGGHLASTIATHSTGDLRPDFQILFYPVITMGEGTHEGSRRNLLGNNPSQEQIYLYSNEKQVTAETPRAFITYTEDDKEVPYEKNGWAYYKALREMNIPVTLCCWEANNGGGGSHGWGGNPTFGHYKELLSGLSDWLETF